jgi:hypothetical protein
LNDLECLKRELKGSKPDKWDVCEYQARVFTLAEKHKQYMLRQTLSCLTDDMKQVSKDLRDLLNRLPNCLDTSDPVVNIDRRSVSWGGKTYQFVDQLQNRLFDGSTFISWSMVPAHIKALLLQFLTPSST